MGGGGAGQASGEEGCPSRSREFCPILGLTSPARASGSLAIGFCLDEAHATCKCPPCPQVPTPTKGPELRPSPATCQGLSSKEMAAGGGAVPVPSSDSVASEWLHRRPYWHAGPWQLWAPQGGGQLQQGPTLAGKGGFPTGPGQPGLLAASAVAPSWSYHPGHNY